MTQPLKRVGARVIQVCEIVDRLGVCGSGEVYRELPLDLQNIIKYLMRATELGLLRVDRSARRSSYCVTENWRAMLPRPKPQKTSSVKISLVPMTSKAMMAQQRAFPLARVWV